ncbi:hypothetical protein ACHAWX_005395 [Stephanocyclus meneghinianus]
MVRYQRNALILTLLTLSSAHESPDDHDHDRASALNPYWTFLSSELPTALSDADESILTFGSKNRIVLTGGCDSPLGNEYKESPEFGGYFECASISNRTYAFDPVYENGEWTGQFEALEDMPRARARHANAVVGGKLCVFGGRDATDAIVAEVDCYDPDTDTWSTPTTLPTAYQASDCAAFARDNTVYLIGGYDSTYTALDRVAVIDMSNMDNVQYSLNPPLLSERGDIDVVIIDDTAYVAGGYTHANNYSIPYDSVEKMDISSGQWSTVDDLNNGAGDQQYVGLNDKIIAIGGETKLNQDSSSTEVPHLGEISTILDVVEVFDPSAEGTPQWISLEDMPMALFRFAAAEWPTSDDEGVIFVFGGQGGFDPDCECFRTTKEVLVFQATEAALNADSSDGSMKAVVSSIAVVAAVSIALLGA